MSLLDDVSIVVTPNGYKAGELYAVVPVPTEGAELVTSWANNDFSSFASSGSNITQMVSSGSGNNNYSLATITSGKLYKLEFTSSQAITCQIRTSTNINLTGATVVLSSLVLGLNEIYFTTSSDYTYIGFYAPNSFTDTQISGFTLKEETKADMDVTRATAATRVDEAGLVNYAEVLGSEEVTNGDFATDANWTKNSGWTISGGSANCDGTQTGNSGLVQQNGIAGVSLDLQIGKQYKMVIDVTVISGAITYIEVASDYQNDDINATGVSTLYFSPTSTNDRITIAANSTFVGSVNSVSVKEVTRDNVPRIDYSGGGCPHILAEPQRTNLVIYSEDFSNAAWSKSSVGIDTSIGTNGINPNIAISPDGTLNSDRVNFLLQSDRDSGMYEIISASTGNSYTTSVYLKGEGSNIGKTIKIRIKRVTGGSFVSVDADYVLTGEWVRLEMNPLTLSGANSNALLVFTSNDATSCLMYGCQVEEGSFPTSIIPTSGSTVTRNQDQFTRDGIGSLINSTEGCIFGEGNFAESNSSGSYVYFASLSDGTTNNRLEIRQTSSNVQFLWRVATYQSQIITSGVDVGSNFKFAVSYSSANIKFYVNGNLIGTISSPTLWSANTLNRLAFDDGAGGNRLSGKVKQLQVYKTALTDEQLIQLTGESGTDFYESYAEMASALTYTIQ